MCWQRQLKPRSQEEDSIATLREYMQAQRRSQEGWACVEAKDAPSSEPAAAPAGTVEHPNLLHAV